MPRIRLDDLDAMQRFLDTRPEARRPIGVRRIVTAPDALAALADVCTALAPDAGAVCAVMDATPKFRDGRRADDALRDALAATGKPVQTIVLREPGHPGAPPHADFTAAERLSRDLPRDGLMVSFGSGTVTDLVKHAMHLRDSAEHRAPQPWVCVPTAASVTAYTSALAVLTVRGVKRTIPSRLPDVIVDDLRLLADAPIDMTRAGFGDMLARCVAHGDWCLARAVGIDRTYSRLPDELLHDNEQALFPAAARVAAREPDAIRTLIEGLHLAGIAMTVVGQTVPISGWEHTLSHALDLRALCLGRPTGLHGLQVGAATLISARYFHTLLDRFDADTADPTAWQQSPDAARHELYRHWSRWGAAPETLEELWSDCRPKCDEWRGRREALRAFVDAWRSGELPAELRRIVWRPEGIEEAMRACGLPTDLKAAARPIAPNAADALDADDETHIIRGAHMIRRRFTLGDVLAALGWLDGPMPPATT